MDETLIFATTLAKLLEPLQQSNDNPLKLIIHVGTPKTGTTSLQIYLDKKQSKLRKKGILYPNRSHNTDAPKHQWFEKNLVRTHSQNLLDNFKEILSNVDENTHTILLSSEGIYNLWWDFPEASKALLVEINKLFNLELWVWFREPVAFAESFYKQCMRNPLVNNISCYGKDLSFSDALKDPWFAKHLDYMDFVTECDALFGDNALHIFEYRHDTVATVRDLLGLSTPHDNPTPRKNNSMSNITTELYRVVNRLELSAKDKEKIVPHLHELNTILTPFVEKENTCLVDEQSRIKINQITEKGILELQTRYVNTVKRYVK